jgi:hypothetical protein
MADTKNVTTSTRTLDCGCKINMRYVNGQDNGSTVDECDACAAPETFYCEGITFRATRDYPAEGCEEEVEEEGMLCRGHQQEQDGPDPDDERDRWLDARWDD